MVHRLEFPGGTPRRRLLLRERGVFPVEVLPAAAGVNVATSPRDISNYGRRMICNSPREEFLRIALERRQEGPADENLTGIRGPVPLMLFARRSCSLFSRIFETMQSLETPFVTEASPATPPAELLLR
ncbi:unnamed protein product [Nippostrongylus brasiliensis]|uniref:LysR_substrate domain-containing protein n=1 Tax=Nippostrongylus brasiliensis TaxID=27835 RepID=A0A0N4XUJ4_NIPBR|nr:unnamed protein product [Nippostrongylus brasiliensis]